jgi:mannose-1-phosphate guanylyltransferase
MTLQLNNDAIVPVVLCGGSGTRMWPMSRTQYPKQFLNLTGDASLLQKTLQRLEFLSQPGILVCNQDHRFLVAEQMRTQGYSAKRILLEPCGKNTAPAIALAALNAMAQGDDPLLFVVAADHVIQDQAAFESAAMQAAAMATKGVLVTFGIKPTSAETGYGYIEPGAALDEHSCVIERFIEKPDQQTADELFSSENYLWNSGMFMFRASAFLHELELYQPEIYNCCLEVSKAQKDQEDFVYLDEALFSECPSLPIDIAVMESTCRAAVVPVDCGWTDLGSWNSLWEISEKDENHNVILGDGLALDSHNNLIKANNRLVSLVGVEDLIVVETSDAVLVAHKDHMQSVKQVTEHLKTQQRSEHALHRQVHRPWGKFDSIDSGERFQVKHITVRPGERLSLQMHHHRAEHWIVVSGTANVTRGNVSQLVSENESVYIPIGETHCLENPGKVPLELIEVQSGAYLGEDDIVRFEDQYNRA